MSKENNKKKKKNVFVNILLFITLVITISNFVITLIYNNDKNLLINSISSLLLCIFSIFFIFVSLTNKRKKVYIMLSSLLLIMFNGINISKNLGLLRFLELNHVEDFTNKSLVDVIKWSEKNKVEVEQIYEYSDTVDEYKIIGQNIKENSLVKDVKKLTVTVSEGPDPNKDVIIPDMDTWNVDRVVDTIKSNYLNNVEIEYIESDDEKDTLVEQSKSGSIKRSDEIKFTFSIGSYDDLSPIKLMNLENKSEFDSLLYLKKNGIKCEVEKEFSSKIKRDYVIKTDKNIGDKLTPNNDDSKVKVIVSKGSKITVPDLKKYSVLKITKWVIKNKLQLEFNEQYDDSIKKGKVISVNYNKGDKIEQKTLITITVSKGSLIMKSFDDLDEFRKWAIKYSVNYEEKYDFSENVDEGKIISFSHKMGDVIKNDDIVVVTISQGRKTTVPDLIDNTKNDAIKKLDNAKLKYTFVYENSTKDKNIVIKQSLSSGSVVAEDSTITVTLSNGKKPTTESSNSTKSTKKSTTNNSNSNNNSNINNQCEEKSLGTITRELLNIFNNVSSASDAEAKLQAYFSSNFSGATLMVKKVADAGSSGSYVGGIAPGTEIKSCNTYTIQIAQ